MHAELAAVPNPLYNVTRANWVIAVVSRNCGDRGLSMRAASEQTERGPSAKLIRRRLRTKIRRSLGRRSATATPQAVSALAEAIARSPADVVGDTDSLLLGLLYSGSYTVDVLQAASARPYDLRRLAKSSVGNVEKPNVDPLHSLFGQSSFTMFAMDAGRKIETSDILRAAISPQHRQPFDRLPQFPSSLARNPRPGSPFGAELYDAMAELLVYFVSSMHTEYDAPELVDTLHNRRSAVTAKEDYALDRRLGIDHTDMLLDELEFAISALNAWFEDRRLLIDPPELCLRTIDRCNPLLFGPRVFVESGGNVNIVDSALAMAEALAPERDLPSIALFNRDGRVQLGQYTYRDTVAVNVTHQQTGLMQRLSLQAIRPTSLISVSTVAAFEDLVSRDNTTELHIQNFLKLHPEFLEALGYTRAIPHVCLREDKNQDLIPDFLLELPGGRGFDILDLKLPQAEIAARQPYLRVSSQITKAIAQLRKYQQFFDRSDNRKQFIRDYGLEAFKPELIVVIGRSSQLSRRDDRIEIESQMHSTKLLTYDDLISYGKSRAIALPYAE